MPGNFLNYPVDIHGAAFVVRHIIFNMMHAQVMAKITFGAMAEKRTNNPGNVSMKPLIFFLKKLSMTNAMKH